MGTAGSPLPPPSRFALIWAALFFTALYLGFFSPILLHGGQLAFGDGYIFYLPAVMRRWSLWEPNILAGYPTFADPQFFTWYPLRWIAPGYNSFVLSAFIIASTSTFGYVSWRLRSAVAGLIAGIVFGCGSFMTAHWGHASIIHAAAWLPLVAWSIDAFGAKRSVGWFCMASLSIAMSVLGGHPQISTYVLLFAGLFSLFKLIELRHEGVKTIAWMAGAYLSLAVLGVAVCAIQIVPFMELSRMSGRAAEWRYEDFVTFSLSLRQLPTIFVPFLFGGGEGNPMRYIGKYSPLEIAMFAGVGTFIFTTIPLLKRKKDPLVVFFLVVLVLSLLIATLEYNGLGHLIFKLPVIGSFRAQARIAVLFTFCLAILSAHGIQYIQSGKASGRDLLVAFLGVAFVVALLVGITLLSKAWNRDAAAVGFGKAAAIRPVLMAFAALLLTGAAALLARWRQFSPLFVLPLLAVVVGDVLQFGWNYGWRGHPNNVDAISTEWRTLEQQIASSGGRALIMKSGTSRLIPLEPNINLLDGVPLANGYGPLIPDALQRATGLMSSGVVTAAPTASLQSILATTYIVYPPDPAPVVQIGTCTGNEPEHISVRLLAPTHVTSLRVLSYLGCAVARENGDVAASIRLRTDSKETSIPLLVGRDTSEWEMDSLGPGFDVRHARAPIASSFAMSGARGHIYDANLKLPMPVNVQELSIEVPSGKGGILSINRIELVDEEGKPTTFDASALGFGTTAFDRYKVDTSMVIRSGNNFRGIAWLVGKTIQLSGEEVALTVRRGWFRDGRVFNPGEAVLLEQPVEPPLDDDSGPAGVVKPRSATADRIVFEVDAAARRLLFVSQSFHPGWRATVNGTEAVVLRTNGAFQGIIVPAGRSVVELRFEPASLRIGGGISAAALAVLAALFPLRWIRNRRRPARAA